VSISSKGSVSYLTGIPVNLTGGFPRAPGHLDILDALILPVMLVNDHYIYEYVNSCCSAAHGKESSEIIGKTVQSLWGQEAFNSHIKRELDRCLEGREVRAEAWVNFPILGRRYCESIYSPYRPDGTKRVWAIMVTYDITDRKNAEEQVENSERRFRSLSEASLEAIIFIENGVVVDANEALYKLFGYQM
jgi:PAS domain S-box-containing protein